MRVNNVSYRRYNNVSYKGIVNFDRKKTEENVKKYPQVVQASILGNFDTLCGELERNTPENQVFDVIYRESKIEDSRFQSYKKTVYYGEPIIRYNGCEFKDKFFIRANNCYGEWSYGKNNQIGQRIYENGFKELRTLTAGETDFDTAVKVQRGYYNLSPAEIAQACKIKKQIDEQVRETERVKIGDKFQLAGSIAKIAAQGVEGSEHVVPSIIGNINTMIARLNSEAPEGFTYSISSSHHLKNYHNATGETGDRYFFDISVQSFNPKGYNDSQYEKEVHIFNKMHADYYFRTGEEIYRQFNALKNQVVDNDWHKSFDM